MDIEADNPAEELEPVNTPAEEIEQEEAEPELDEDGNPIEGPDESEEDGDDLEDVEIDGKTYKVPKDAAFRQADYTRKTMALAERAKEVEATIERLNSVGQAETQALAQVAIVAAQLKQYEGIDWDAWEDLDAQQGTREAQKHWRIYQQLEKQQAEAVQAYNNAGEAKRSATQQETAKRLQEAEQLAAERIPGWSGEKAKATLDYTRSTYGLTNDELMSAISEKPGVIELLHDAMEGRKARKQTATVKKIEKQQAVKPAATVKGASGTMPKGLDDRLSGDEWLRRRNAQVAKQGR